jgi:hypothetical protein
VLGGLLVRGEHERVGPREGAPVPRVAVHHVAVAATRVERAPVGRPRQAHERGALHERLRDPAGGAVEHLHALRAGAAGQEHERAPVRRGHERERHAEHVDLAACRVEALAGGQAARAGVVGRGAAADAVGCGRRGGGRGAAAGGQ